MVVRSKGIRSKTRQTLRKHPRSRGLPPPTHALREFPEGTRVAITVEPSVHGGMPHIRFQGQTGVVTGKQGSAFVVAFEDRGMAKTLVVRPEHLRELH